LDDGAQGITAQAVSSVGIFRIARSATCRWPPSSPTA